MKGGIAINIFKRKEKPNPVETPVQTVARSGTSLDVFDSCVFLGTNETKLYYKLREAIPIIDAAIFKLIRLTGGFSVKCENESLQSSLDYFVENVNVGGNQRGLDAFVSSYFEQLLTCGTAVGEMVVDEDGRIAALFNSPLNNIQLKRASDGVNIKILTANCAYPKEVTRPELVILSVLNPDAGALHGNSLLKGLPFVSSIIMKIFNTIGLNWERIGNVRFAVTYKPNNDSMDRAYAKERAMQVAKEWGEAMQTGAGVKDFVAVGDVQIKVIGADNQILDSEVPVRQMLEQIVAKTGLPPFMLGLSWSTTERMSGIQADVLTSELDSYRRILTPVVVKICESYLTFEGTPSKVEVIWDDVMLQDNVELAKAELYSAQAEKIKNECKE